MAEASRTKKSIHNSTVALFFYALNFLLTFFSRKIFLDYLGTEILGLNTTAVNLLQFLNLAELGISSAVGFSLYKPLHEKDLTTVNEIVTLQGHLYKRIALLILAGSFILMAFFPLIFKKIHLPLWYTYASFGALMVSSFLGYFFNYKSIVLSASQQDYKIQYSTKTTMIVKILLQMWAVYKLNNGYVWWLIIEVVFAVITSILLHIATVKEFPDLLKSKGTYKELRTKYNIIVVKVKQVFFHKVGAFAISQTSPLIIYAFTTLTTVALYGNYMTIINGIIMLTGAIFNSMGAGVGNLIAEGNEEKIRLVFCELFSMRFLLVSTLAFCIYSLGESFITVWLGEEYLLPSSTLLILSIFLFISLYRFTVDIYISSYGLYGDIWAPVIEALINIGSSVGLGYAFGLNGILLGVIISQIIVIVLWKPYYLIHKKLMGFMKTYIKLNIIHFLIFAFVTFICLFFLKPIIENSSLNYIHFFINASILAISFALLSWGLLFIFSKGMRDFSSRMFNLIKVMK